MGTNFWWQCVDKGIVDFVRPASQRAVFFLQFGNFFFQLFDFLSDCFPLSAWKTWAAFRCNAGYRLVLRFDSGSPATSA